jgi:hypothetical protein
VIHPSQAVERAVLVRESIALERVPFSPLAARRRTGAQGCLKSVKVGITAWSEEIDSKVPRY